VIASFGRQFGIATDDGRPLLATRRGKRGDVVVGDRVSCRPAGDGLASIESIEPRRTLLFRADTWRTKELAANVDQVAIVFAPRPAFNPRFLWRALVAATAAGVPPLVVLNKSDLPSDEASATLAALAALGYATLQVSARHDAERTRRVLLERLLGHATLLVGQSGMGKSTLLNLLVPDANARTAEFSTRLNLGRQTTTAARWFSLGAADHRAGAVVDTPGFQEFGLAHLAPREVAAAMPDLAPLAGACRFADCRHVDEPGCAVRAAVDGRVARDRYVFYRELAESAGTA
jgi:ribosome biogenesis GTPase